MWPRETSYRNELVGILLIFELQKKFAEVETDYFCTAKKEA